jgi:hypothetical protein
MGPGRSLNKGSVYSVLHIPYHTVQYRHAHAHTYTHAHTRSAGEGVTRAPSQRVEPPGRPKSVGVPSPRAVIWIMPARSVSKVLKRGVGKTLDCKRKERIEI